MGEQLLAGCAGQTCRKAIMHEIVLLTNKTPVEDVVSQFSNSVGKKMQLAVPNLYNKHVQCDI